jgi:hypothetical protein
MTFGGKMISRYLGRISRTSRFRAARSALTFVVLLLVSATGQTAQASDAISSWGVFSTDSIGLAYDSDLLLSDKNNSLTPCQGGFDSCKSPGNFTIMNTLVPCASSSLLACIDSVSASYDGKTWVMGQRVGERVPNWAAYNYEARPDLGSPASHGPNLYRFAGIESDNSDTFDVSPRLQAVSLSGKKFEPKSISARIQAVKKDVSFIRAPYTAPHQGLSGDEWLKTFSSCLDGSHITNDCWVADTQSKPIYFKLKLALASVPDGWVSGRLFDPGVTFGSTSEHSNLPNFVSISGVSVVVPTLAKTYFNFNPDEKATWDALGPSLNSPWANDGLSRGLSLSPLDIGKFTKGVSTDSSWNHATTERAEWVANLSWTQQFVHGSSCSRPGFEGFIGSNALVYESNLPTFDARTKELSYVVASPHFRVNGAPQAGVYSLLMTEAYARCVWNTGSKLARVEISITGDEGASKEATTVLSVSGGYVRFLASGFNFSKVNLRAKLASEPEVTFAHAPRGTTISCVKGKLTKKVTAVGPKCPAGYKKK